MSDEDPFGVFSDDDEDDRSDNDDSSRAIDESPSEVAKSLMDRVNAKLQSQQDSSNPAIPNSTHDVPQEEDPLDRFHVERRIELDWPPPLYLGPMVLVSLVGVGGGRGYVATRNLPPGTLILVEEPAMKWSEEQLGRALDWISIQYLLDHPLLVKDMELFHPTKDDVDHHANDEDKQDQIGRILHSLLSEEDQEPKEEVRRLVRLAKQKGVTSRNGSDLNEQDILRLFVALRYNGLETGVYRHVAMLNHDCHPNCAKFFPQDDHHYSEVRTTRPVLVGDSLTISYLPRIMSHASRRKYLWEQHRFDIGAHIRKPFLKMELVGNDLPPSHVQRWEEESLPHRVETSTAELETMLDEITEDIKGGEVNADSWETLKALEQGSLELYKESTQQLKNSEYILLNSILLIHVEACEQLRKAPALSSTVQVGILARQIESLHRLLPLQMARLGKDHFDLARSNLDLATGVSELLSRSPKSLYELNLPSLGTFDQWSALAGLSRQEHKRIKELYPHDAEDYIGNRAHHN